MSRERGYYVCEIDYDMIREVMWWDGSGFFAAGNEVAYTESDFTFISARSIDLYADIEMIAIAIAGDGA